MIRGARWSAATMLVAWATGDDSGPPLRPAVSNQGFRPEPIWCNSPAQGVARRLLPPQHRVVPPSNILYVSIQCIYFILDV
jgi:hypothetical protein